jgi:SAM-dependent methyltransferase
MKNEKDIKTKVKEAYSKIAKNSSSCCSSSNCCGGISSTVDISKKIGYTDEDLRNVPEGANLGLGCGNPLFFADLKEGETVLDLGSGAGFDCFLAAKKVGEKGKVIGIDMTESMVKKAKENAKKGGFKNVEFKIGEIENLPIEDNSIDLIISNCVINLSPDKGKVFKEAYRVLRKGGRMVISDIVLLKGLPDFIKNSTSAYTGCISGAMIKEEYINEIYKAGFKEVKILDESFFSLYCIISDPDINKIKEDEKKELQRNILSIKISAFKR